MSKRKYVVRRRPKLCHHLTVKDEFGPGLNFIDLYSIRLGCKTCERFFDWVNKVWDDAAPRSRAQA